MKSLLAITAIALALAACGPTNWEDRHPGARALRGDPSGIAAGIKQMQSYDANKDGTVTRAEMEAQLKKDFAAADLDRNGTLNADEARAENARRYAAHGTQYSPLLDWNQDTLIDYAEFAGAPRSLFDQLDRDNDGELSGTELKPPRGPVLEERKQPASQDRRTRRRLLDL
ncbi:MAG: hypothetical protein ACT4OG_08565 [Alphaproteobacteria bacterium]